MFSVNERQNLADASERAPRAPPGRVGLWLRTRGFAFVPACLF